MRSRLSVFPLLTFALSLFGCSAGGSTSLETPAGRVRVPRGTEYRPLPAGAPPGLKEALDYGLAQTNLTRTYDPAYVRLDYPAGDLPLERGVCTDVVIRAFRQGGVDLQKEVHEDMKADFAAYPDKWGATAPDSNIDHRRVPNLRTFFERRGKSLPITGVADDYQPGDVISCVLSDGGPTHVGLVTNLYLPATGRYLVVHNIGGGAQIQDVLFSYKITGHYRYF